MQGLTMLQNTSLLRVGLVWGGAQWSTRQIQKHSHSRTWPETYFYHLKQGKGLKNKGFLLLLFLDKQDLASDSPRRDEVLCFMVNKTETSQS